MKQDGPENFALIIGAMKAGTTTLFDLLAEHPAICGCSIKEPGFFATEESWRRGFEHYQALWKWKENVHQVALEGSTSYAKRPRYEGVSERIARTRGKYRLIYVVRDPVARIESHRRHEIAWARRSSCSAGLSEEEVAFSKYAMQLDGYFEHFDWCSVRIIRFEDLVHRPESVLRELCKFLGVDPQFTFPNVERMANTPKVLPKCRRKVIKSSAIQWVARRLPRKMRRRFRDSFAVPVRRSEGTLSSAEREQARSALYSDIDRLKRVYRVDTTDWEL